LGEGEEELAGAAQAFELTAVASEIPGVDEVMIRVECQSGDVGGTFRRAWCASLYESLAASPPPCRCFFGIEGSRGPHRPRRPKVPRPVQKNLEDRSPFG